MNQISSKLFGVLAIFLFIAVMPIVVLATNEDVSVVSVESEESQTEYIIYIKDYTDKKFKYAFSNNANPEIMDLVYINSIATNVEENQESNQVAFLDAKTYEKFLNQTIYMWAKDENENLILNGIQLDLTKSLSKNSIDSVESVTKRINVKIADSEEEAAKVRNENINGVEQTASVGYIEITDSKKATYYYERVKIADSEEYTKLMNLAEQINNEYDEMDMYNKVQLGTEFYNLYAKLVSEVEWQEVENMKVEQPEESVAGEKYIVFLKKVSKQDEIIDAQFLTAYDDYKPNVVKEQIITQETTRLPITYDSIALIVILAIVVIALVIVFIRMKKLSKKNEEE